MIFIDEVTFADRASAGGKQVISDYQAQYDDNDGEEAVRDEEHDRHADAEPKQYESQEPFHELPPSFYVRITGVLAFYYFMQSGYKGDGFLEQ